MSEREIRDAIEQVCDNLDLEARAEAKRRGRKLVYPLMLGAGLLVATCDDETETDRGNVVLYGGPSGTPTATQTGTGSGTTTGTATGGGTATGAGGQGGTATGAGGSDGGAGGSDGGAGGAGGGPLPPYMAPDP